ncbi:hypothetical protein SAMN05216392_0348 [Streptococcus equinus]|uniref:Uncharacterized protein n=1 Tax=Streptococcus equinus TaxID=1335 RepID=A0A1H0Y0S7_STREI|nr:hypothetical protein [Streptococcus equinus]MCO4651003.1 hypothetical protein [Streptococcus infantarius subsp. infantarius]QBX24846.1 hypothetical protein Javan214_0009 [Streptococcus phage Javan214]SDQ08779.1 hypothetical protein SAMN05216392_0348 [Streptococcus equinus]
MTYLIIGFSFLVLSEVFTLTLLRRREETIEYYRSKDYEDLVFMKRVKKNSEMWAQAQAISNRFEEE